MQKCCMSGWEAVIHTQTQKSTFLHFRDSESSQSALSLCCPFYLLSKSSLQSSAVRPHISAWHRLGQDCWSEGRYLGQWTLWEVAGKLGWMGKERGEMEEQKGRGRHTQTHPYYLTLQQQRDGNIDRFCQGGRWASQVWGLKTLQETNIALEG